MLVRLHVLLDVVILQLNIFRRPLFVGHDIAHVIIPHMERSIIRISQTRTLAACSAHSMPSFVCLVWPELLPLLTIFVISRSDLTSRLNETLLIKLLSDMLTKHHATLRRQIIHSFLKSLRPAFHEATRGIESLHCLCNDCMNASARLKVVKLRKLIGSVKSLLSHVFSFTNRALIADIFA